LTLVPFQPCGMLQPKTLYCLWHHKSFLYWYCLYKYYNYYDTTESFLILVFLVCLTS